MTVFSRSIALILIAAALAACNRTPNIRIAGDQPLKHLTIEDDRVGVRSTEGDMAWIGADGSLLIDGQPVVLDAPQRALTVRFYTQAHAIRDDGVAIGKSGAAMAGKSVRSVVRGLTRGNPDDIGPEIEAEARVLEAHAMRLCARVGTLQSVQDELAQAVPAFTPFATISNTHTEACTQDVVDDRSSDASTGDAVASPSQN